MLIVSGGKARSKTVLTKRLKSFMPTKVGAWTQDGASSISSELLINLLGAMWDGSLLDPKGKVTEGYSDALRELGVLLRARPDFAKIPNEVLSDHGLALSYLNALLFFDGDCKAFGSVLTKGAQAIFSTPAVFDSESRLGVSWVLSFSGDQHLERGARRVMLNEPLLTQFVTNMSQHSIVRGSTHGKGADHTGGKGLGFGCDVDPEYDKKCPFGLATQLVIPSFNNEEIRELTLNRLDVIQRTPRPGGASFPNDLTLWDMVIPQEVLQHVSDLSRGSLTKSSFLRELKRVAPDLTDAQKSQVWDSINRDVVTGRVTKTLQRIENFGINADTTLPECLTSELLTKCKAILNKFYAQGSWSLLGFETSTSDIRRFNAMTELGLSTCPEQMHLLFKFEMYGLQRADHAEVHNSVLLRTPLIKNLFSNPKESPNARMQPELGKALHADFGKRSVGKRKEHMSKLGGAKRDLLALVKGMPGLRGLGYTVGRKFRMNLKLSEPVILKAGRPQSASSVLKAAIDVVYKGIFSDDDLLKSTKDKFEAIGSWAAFPSNSAHAQKPFADRILNIVSVMSERVGHDIFDDQGKLNPQEGKEPIVDFTRVTNISTHHSDASIA